jgi:hypothetical protein
LAVFLLWVSDNEATGQSLSEKDDITEKGSRGAETPSGKKDSGSRGGTGLSRSEPVPPET